MSDKQRLDWQAARELLERTRLAIESGQRSHQRLKTLRRTRAELLARPAEVDEAESGEAILVFRLAAALFGLPLSRVAEVFPQPPIASVPHGPAEISGLIQIRGEIRVVWDLTRILATSPSGSAEAAPGEARTVLLVRNAAGNESGFLVEEVMDIRTVSQSDRLSPPETVNHAIWATADLVTVLEIDALLSGLNGENATA